MVEWSIFNEIFAVAFNVLYFVIIIGTIFIVILDNRNPVKTMAWVLGHLNAFCAWYSAMGRFMRRVNPFFPESE